MELFRIYLINGGQVIVKGDWYKVSDRTLSIYNNKGVLIATFSIYGIAGIVKESYIERQYTEGRPARD